MATYILLLQVLTFIFNLALGVFIFAKNPKKNTNQAFALFSLGVAGWNISIFFTIVGFLSSLFWGRIAWFFAALMAAGLLWFVHLFPESTKHAKAWTRISVFLGVTFAILGGSPFMVKSVAVVDGYITGALNVGVYYAWDLFFLISLLYALIFSWRRTLKATGLMRSQLMQVSIGITAFVVPFLVTNIILPLFANDFRWNNLGPIFTIFLIGFIARAIVQFRFLEIKWVIKRGADLVLQWILVFAIISGFQFFLQGSLSSNLIQVTTAFCIATFFLPIAKYINDWSERVASRGSYHYHDAVSDISELANASIDLPLMQKKTAAKLEDFFGYSRVAFVAVSPQAPNPVSEEYIKGFSRSILKVIPDAIRVSQAYHFSIVETSELRWRSEAHLKSEPLEFDIQALRSLRDWGVAVLIPLYVGRDVVGMIFLGEKPNASVLTERDLGLLRVLQGTLSPAVSNGVRFDEMKRLYVQLSELDKAKSDFIDVVSHQFRTPLTSILWDSEVAMDQDDIKKAEKKTFTEIHQSAEYLNRTLNTVLNLLEIDNQKGETDKQRVDFTALVKKSVEQCTGVCKEKHVRVDVQVDPATVLANENKLAALLESLLKNACDYNTRGGTMTISLQANPSDRKLTLKIADTGIGISDEDLPHIFEKFYRTKDAKLASPNGTGISMYLARIFLEKYRGSINVSSKIGKGSTVTITLPLAPKKVAAQPVRAEEVRVNEKI